jgi:hypothetical protein
MNKRTWVSLALVTGIASTLAYQNHKHQATIPNPISYEDGLIEGNIGLIDGALKEANKYQDPDLDKSKVQLTELKSQLLKMKTSSAKISDVNDLFNSNHFKLKSIIAYTHKASIPSAVQCLKSTTTDSKQIVLFQDYLTRRANIEIALAAQSTEDPELVTKLDKIIQSSRVEDTKCGF